MAVTQPFTRKTDLLAGRFFCGSCKIRAKAVALVGNLGKLVSGDLFRRRFSGLTAYEMGIHFSLQHGFNEALGEGTDGLGEGFGAQRAARCSKLGNVLADMVIEGVGGLLTRIAFGIRVHWMHPIGGLRLSHGHKISDALKTAGNSGKCSPETCRR